ncbi:MAG: helix-turn-helix domain-containing protein, partial [Vulcanimicrobiaceae bacterium]
MPSLGDEFRVAREARGLSLSDVAEQLHIRSTYLQAIEEEDWPAIGAPVYVKGFLRTYARFLGVDPDHAIEALGRTLPAPPPNKQWTPGPRDGISSPRSGPSIWAWLAGLLAIALLG